MRRGRDCRKSYGGPASERKRRILTFCGAVSRECQIQISFSINKTFPYKNVLTVVVR